MCPQAPPPWLLIAGIIVGFLLMVGAVRTWGLKGGTVMLCLMAVGAVWAVLKIIQLHRMGC